MHKRFLLVVIFACLIVACGGGGLPTQTATAVPTETATPVVSASPVLIKEIKLETQTDTAYTLEWSPDGRTLAVASGHEITMLSGDLEIQTVLRPEHGALAITWSPDQTKFATVFGFRNQVMKIWDWDSAENQLTLNRDISAGSDQYGVFWSPDGSLLATLADDDKSTFQIWDALTGDLLNKYTLPFANPLRTSSWSGDGTTLYAAGESSGQIIVYGLNVEDGTTQELVQVPAEAAAVFAVSPDAKILAIGDERGTIEFLDLGSGDVFSRIKAVEQPVDLGWNPDGRTLAVLSYKTILQLWEMSP